MDDLNIRDVKTKHEERDYIWKKTGRWYYYQYLTIKSFIYKRIRRLNIPFNIDIVNLGSGGNPYCFEEKNMSHVDIVGKNIAGKPRSLISNIDKLEISDNSYNYCLCAGNVINYTDVFMSIKEIGRILKSKDLLCLKNLIFVSELVVRLILFYYFCLWENEITSLGWNRQGSNSFLEILIG
jgi:hypothetical protein